MTVREPRWTDTDRALVRALVEYEADTCSSCGHQMSECHDPKTARTWEVITHVCEPTRVAQVEAERVHESKKRGVMISTRRHVGG